MYVSAGMLKMLADQRQADLRREADRERQWGKFRRAAR
jgi:hypothetical protein